jgi:DNA polymerase III sliding clamp (beta) subunit (PCNA family)
MNTIIKLPVAELKSAISGLTKVVSKRTTLPVLGMIRVTCDRQGCVDLSGTDLDSFVTARIQAPGPVGDPVQCLVPFAELQKLGKTCATDEVLEIEPISEDKLILRHRIGNQPVEQVITSAPMSDYPPAPEITMPSIDLDESARGTLLQALACASDDSTRVILNGAYLDVSKPTGHYAVATDGRHLFASNSLHLDLPSSVLVPDHRFITWSGFTKDGLWKLTAQEATKKIGGYVRIESSRWTFITKQIEGNYPNWRQIADDVQKVTGTVEISDAAAAEIQRILPRLPGADTPNHVIGLFTAGNRLYLRGRNNDQDRWTEVEVPEVQITGDPATVYLNREYLLKAIGFGLRQISVQEPLRPLQFSDGGSRKMIVMPVRVEDQPASAPKSGPAPEPVNSTTPAAPEVPAKSPEAPNIQQPERNTTMQNANNQNGNGNGNRPATEPAPTEKPTLEQALDQIEAIKGTIRGAVANLNTLADTVRQVQRERRQSEREVRNVRDTLKTLQTVRL